MKKDDENQGKFQCDMCPKVYARKGYLENHIAKDHPKDNLQNDPDEKQQESDSIEHSCEKCSEKFSNLLDLASHLNKKHERVNNRLHCPVCPKDFRQVFHHLEGDS